MKIKKWPSCEWIFVFAVAYASMITNLLGQGSVVFSGRLSLGTNGFPFGGDYQLTVVNTPDGSGYTTIFLNRQGSQISFETTFVDEVSSWYFADFNDAFTTASIKASDFVFFGGHPDLQPGPYFDVGYFRPFYLAVASGRIIWNPPSGESYWIDPVFGWGLFNNTPTGLVLLDSAVAYGSEGIVVGTITTVPEPAAIGIFLAGGLALLLASRLRRPPQ